MISSRRHFLGASAATAVAASFLPRAQAQDAGTMSFASSARSPNSLEPAFVVQGADNWVTMQIFDTLVRPEDGTFAVTPGAIQTEAEREMFPDQEGIAAWLAKEQAVPRRGVPDDIAAAVRYLVSDSAAFVSGQTINVDGGWAMH